MRHPSWSYRSSHKHQHNQLGLLQRKPGHRAGFPCFWEGGDRRGRIADRSEGVFLSDAALVRPPDYLMQLQLEARPEPIGQEPLCQLPGFQLPEYG